MARRPWFFVAFVLAVAFALYGSLVPFGFHGPFTAARVVATLRHSLAGGPSRSDFVANVLLFLPIGFFGGGFAAPPRRGPFRRLAGSVVVIAIAAATSLVCEGLQVFIPARVASLWDVTAETSGAVCGLAAWLALGAELHRWLDHWLSGQTGTVWRPWLVLYALGRFFVMFYPFDVTLDVSDLAHKFRSGGVVLNPLHSPALNLETLPALLLAFIVAVPVGVLACVIGVRAGRRRRTIVSLAIATAVFGLAEAAQVFILSCRADSLEWAVNAAGAAVGVLLVAGFSTAAVGDDKAERTGSRLAAGGLVASLLFYAVYNWSPFDFHLSWSMVRTHSETLFATPFYGYWVNPEFKALGEALVKLSLGAPMGVFLRWWLGASSSGYRRLTAAGSVVALAAFVSIVEVGQVFLPSRYADDTDILLALVGAGVGAIAAGLAGLGAQTNRQAAREVDRRASSRTGPPETGK